jgi:uncharacterized membrane protein YphA (DoxX/SURF4 family)
MSQSRRRDPLGVVFEIERQFLWFVKNHSLQFLRYSLVVVFVWFGMLTATGMSETAGLVADAFGFIPADLFLLLLGAWEITIGLALVSRRTVRLALALLLVHLMVMMVPLVMYPSETFTYFPYGPSFEGVYIIKDFVLLGAVMAVGGLLTGTDEQ